MTVGLTVSKNVTPRPSGRCALFAGLVSGSCRRAGWPTAIEDFIDAIGESVAGAAVQQGPPSEAMRRLVAAMVAVGDRLVFLFGDPRVLEGYGTGGTPPPPDDPVIALIERGQAEGGFDPDVSPEWIQRVLWSLVYTGHKDADACGLPRHGIVSTVIRTLENGIRA